eukprot:692801-Rhodomonas_salina.1
MACIAEALTDCACQCACWQILRPGPDNFTREGSILPGRWKSCCEEIDCRGSPSLAELGISQLEPTSWHNATPSHSFDFSQG